MPKIKMNSWLMNWTGFVTRNTQAEFDDIKFEDGPEWMQLMWESWLKNSDHGWKILEKKRIKKTKNDRERE